MGSGEGYWTVAGRGEVAFEIRGSEFIGHAIPARTVEAAEAFIDDVGAAHPDASHDVPAYRVRTGTGMVRSWSSDDGEPSGSAGKPALNVLEQRELLNVAVVISRYHGGTKLGVGGLARAYSRGAKDAVEAAGIVERSPHRAVSIAVGYDDSGTVRGIIESEGYEFEAEYRAAVEFTVVVPVAEADAVLERVRSATSGRAEIDG